MIENPTEAKWRILKFLGVSSTKDTSEIYRAINALKHTYLIQASDGSYCFTHESLKENVASEFIFQHTSLAIEIADFKYIVEYINGRDPKTDLESRRHTPIDVDCIKPLADRMVKEILLGNAAVVAVCNAWNDKLFLQEWMTNITNNGQENMFQILTYSRGRYPDCPIVRPMEELRSPNYICDVDDTLLEFLTKLGKYDAALAMLENKVINAYFMKEHEIWKKITQHVLDHTDCTIKADILVAKSVLNNIRETGFAMDGTVALKNALMISDLAYAFHLLENTFICPNVIDESSGGVFHHLVLSDLKFEDFDKISNMLVRLGADINLCNNAGYSPLLLCMQCEVYEKQFIERFDCLIRHGANINMKDLTGRSALYMYVEKILASNGLPEDCKIKVKYLVSKGADVNTRIYDNEIGILHMLVISNVSLMCSNIFTSV